MVPYKRLKNKEDKDEPSKKLIAESNKRRAKFARKAQEKKAGEKLESGDVGKYALKGTKSYRAPVSRKKGSRQVSRGKSKTYLIPESEKREKKVMKAVEKDIPAMHHRTGTAKKTTTTITNKQTGDIVGKDVKVTGPISRRKVAEGTTAEFKKKGYFKDSPEKVGEMQYKTVSEAPSKKVSQARQANKVAFERPDKLVTTKSKSVRRKGERTASKSKKVIKTKNLVARDFKDRETVRTKPVKTKVDGGKKVVKTIKRGDTTIVKEKFKRKRKRKKDTFYRQ